MNQLLLCSRYGRRELYMVKLAAGFTWILTAALIVFLSVMIPYFGYYGTKGTGEMLQLVKKQITKGLSLLRGRDRTKGN